MTFTAEMQAKQQFCSKAIEIPSICYSGIGNSSISASKFDTAGNYVTIDVNMDVPNAAKPKITLSKGDVLFLNSSGQYVAFDPDLVSNVYATANFFEGDTINSCFAETQSYPLFIKIQPLDCSLPMKLSNLTLYSPKNQYILNVSSDGNKMILGDFNDLQNCTLKNQIINLDGQSYKPKESFFFEIQDDLLSDVLYHPSDSKKITTLQISKDLDLQAMPSLTITDGLVQYLDQDGIYQNFDPLLYKNINATAYKTSDLLGSSIFNSYMLRISPDNSNNVAMISDQTIYPIQHYSIKNVDDDGTIHYIKIKSIDYPFLQ